MQFRPNPSLAFACAVALGAAAFPSAAAEGPVPPALAVPAPAIPTLRVQGRGEQIYVCASRPDSPGAYVWNFQAPRADLYGPDGKRVGRHFAGPTWEGADGGRVVGELVAKAPSPDPAAIDWLLLRAKSANGVGVLGRTTYVRRIHTVGGRAPDAGCSSGASGAETRVPYTADYEFYAAP